MNKALKFAAAMALAATLLPGQPTRSAEVQWKAAQHKEEVEGDLRGAIDQYRKVVHTTDRALAAKALIRMADCYRRLGDAEAHKIYERVVRDYGEQKEAVALARARMGGAQQPRRPTNALVWSGKKANTGGTVSSDGRYISFTDWDTGDLALHEINSGVDRRLTNKGTWKESDDFAEESAISRDGKQVAYTWWKVKDKRPELRIASIVGDPNPRRLYDNPDISWIRPCDWSPDGKSLAVEIKRPDRTKQIGLISVPGGSLRVLKSLDWRGAGSISFSPDGKNLGYDLPERDTGSQRDVFILSVDGVRESRAVTHPSNDLMFGWSPEGKWLLYASDRTGSMGLWGLPLADGKLQGSPELLRADFAARAEPIGVTNSGALYYRVAGNQNRFKIQIASVDFATGKYLSEPTDLTQDYLESNAVPMWSPDGRQLAYNSIRGPAQKPTHVVVLIRSMDTGQIRELRPKLSYFGPMVWAPDGHSFITLGGDLKGRAGIYQINAETGAESTLVLDQPGQKLWYPAWARDGKSFYFQREYRATKDSAYIQRDVATGRETELIRRRVLSQVGISPDGRYFASRSVDESTNSRTIILIAVNGGEVRELVRYSPEVPPEDLADANKGLWLKQGLWAADSQSLLAYKIRGDQRDPLNKSFETWRIPINGDEPRKLEGADLRMSGGNLAGPQLHPDGRRIAFYVMETTPRRDPEVWALENFLPVSSTK